MLGNMSTGMRASVVPPRTAMTRPTTIMKYGFRIANLDMGDFQRVWKLPLRFPKISLNLRQLRAGLLSGPKTRPISGHNHLAFTQAGTDFNPVLRLGAQLD